MESKEQIKKRNKNFYKKNKIQLKIRFKEYNNNHKEQIRNQKLLSLYGITLDDYNRMLEEQNGVCAICGQKEK